MAQGVPHFMLWSMMALVLRLTTHESGVVPGVVRLYFQHLFSFVFFVCSFLSSSLSFSQTFTSSLFIVSFVYSVLLLKSNHCGRMIVCNAKQCWQKSSLQCEGWALLCWL